MTDGTGDRQINRGGESVAVVINGFLAGEWNAVGGHWVGYSHRVVTALAAVLAAVLILGYRRSR